MKPLLRIALYTFNSGCCGALSGPKPLLGSMWKQPRFGSDSAPNNHLFEQPTGFQRLGVVPDVFQVSGQRRQWGQAVDS